MDSPYSVSVIVAVDGDIRYYMHVTRLAFDLGEGLILVNYCLGLMSASFRLSDVSSVRIEKGAYHVPEK